MSDDSFLDAFNECTDHPDIPDVLILDGVPVYRHSYACRPDLVPCVKCPCVCHADPRPVMVDEIKNPFLSDDDW